MLCVFYPALTPQVVKPFAFVRGATKVVDVPRTTTHIFDQFVEGVT